MQFTATIVTHRVLDRSGAELQASGRFVLTFPADSPAAARAAVDEEFPRAASVALRHDTAIAAAAVRRSQKGSAQ